MSSLKPDFIQMRQRMKEARKALGLAQEEIGKPLGFRKQDISAVESGRRNPGLHFIWSYASEYNLSVDWLLFGTGEMFRK